MSDPHEHEFPPLDDDGDQRDPCACGLAYVEHDLDDLAEKIAPGLVAEHGQRPYVQDIAVYAEDYCRENGVALGIGDFEILVDLLGDLAPTLTLTAS